MSTTPAINGWKGTILKITPAIIWPVALISLIVGTIYNKNVAVFVAVASNLTIALGYMLIGLFIAPKFSLAAPQKGAQIARACGLGFFITCAMTHMEMTYHGTIAGVASPEDWRGFGSWVTSWHGLIIHCTQAAFGITFFCLAILYLGVLIVDREVYEQVVDARIRRTLARLKDRDLDYALLKADVEKDV